MFRINSKKLQKKLINILDIYWKDNMNSWRLDNDGKYKKLSPMNGDKELSAQEYFLEKIKNKKSN